MLDSVHSICTISLCLLECACMQVRIEEQDDQDRESISLMGRTGAPDTASSSTSASTNAGGGTGMEHNGSI